MLPRSTLLALTAPGRAAPDEEQVISADVAGPPPVHAPAVRVTLMLLRRPAATPPADKHAG